MSILGALVGGIFSAAAAKKGSERQAEAAQIDRGYNTEEAEKARQFNAGEAQLSRDFLQGQFNSAQSFNAAEQDKNRQFQQMMSDTSYQRAVGDMKSAGLNPMLAYSQGGASGGSGGAASISPGGSAQASGPAAAPAKAVTAMGAGEAMLGSASQILDIDRKIKENELLEAQAGTTKSQGVKTDLEAQAKRVELPYLLTLTEERVRHAQHETSERNLSLLKQMEESRHYYANAKTHADQEAAKLRLLELNEEATRNGIPETEAWRDFWKSGTGRAAPYMREAEGLVNSASSVVGNTLRGVTDIFRAKRKPHSGSYSETTYDRSGNVTGGRSRDYANE